jgi:hypothetical protein
MQKRVEKWAERRHLMEKTEVKNLVRLSLKKKPSPHVKPTVQKFLAVFQICMLFRFLTCRVLYTHLAVRAAVSVIYRYAVSQVAVTVISGKF